ncbi:MAG: cytochrome C [Chlorobi bacterium]|nr:cytochrome C [Chlorobiota bacterium]
MKNQIFKMESSKSLKFQKRRLMYLTSIMFSLLLLPKNVFAIPSFARQTGMACVACHTIFPQLNSFGRSFKLNGYTLTNIKTVKDEFTDKDKNDVQEYLRILGIAPLSAMFQTGYTSLKKSIPDTQNNNFEFPQQMSLFYGGQISPKMGAFIQLTLDNESGTLGMDNTDIRYANQTFGSIPISYGFTLNNNPTVQDLWNTTPAWGYPYTASGIAPTPGAGTIIENLGGTVVGLGGYAMINNLFYVELTGYRTAQLGAALPPDATVNGVVNGTSPYWRAAVQHQFGKSYLEVGAFGISTKLYPNGVTGATDNYNDIAFDLQYEYMFSKGQFTIHTSYINEKQKLNASFASNDSQNLDNNLNKFKIDGSIFLKPNINITTGYFNTTGSLDSGLYAPGIVFGSNTRVPDSNGITAQFDYLPWENTKISIQYLAYNKFNGSSNNYDGFGRKASDNNTLYLQLWFAF